MYPRLHSSKMTREKQNNVEKNNIKHKTPSHSKNASESSSDDSDYNVPLAKIFCRTEPASEPSSCEIYNSDSDPEFKPGLCEAKRCKDEIWAACHVCESMLCYSHFMEEKPSCPDHGEKKKVKKNQTQQNETFNV